MCIIISRSLFFSLSTIVRARLLFVVIVVFIEYFFFLMDKNVSVNPFFVSMRIKSHVKNLNENRRYYLHWKTILIRFLGWCVYVGAMLFDSFYYNNIISWILCHYKKRGGGVKKYERENKQKHTLTHKKVNGRL